METLTGVVSSKKLIASIGLIFAINSTILPWTSYRTLVEGKVHIFGGDGSGLGFLGLSLIFLLSLIFTKNNGIESITFILIIVTMFFYAMFLWDAINNGGLRSFNHKAFVHAEPGLYIGLLACIVSIIGSITGLFNLSPPKKDE